MRIARALLPLGAALALSACGGGGDGGTNPPPSAVFTSVAVTPGSPSIAVGETQTLTAAARDQNGNPMSGTPTRTFDSSDETKATVTDAGVVTAVAVGGPVTITATVTLNGVTKTGTAAVTVIPAGTFPLAATVTAQTANAFTPATIDIARTGTVSFVFESTIHNVQFDTNAGAPSDIPNRSNTTVDRTFNTAGTFGYDCGLHPGMSGTVVVH
jgi:plastocyanin